MPSEDDYLKVLVDYFTDYVGDNFDVSLSHEYMKFLTPMIDHYSADELNEQLNDFVRVYKDKWMSGIEHLRIVDRDYLVQPELLLMFYLLDKDKYILADVLNGEIPLSDVDEIFMCWGLPADDFRP